MDLKTLQRMTVPKLREEASKIPDLTAVRGMSKEELVRAVAAARGIPLAGRARGGAGKADLKRQIRALRAEIQEAISAKRVDRVKELRLRVKRLKRETRRLGRKPAAPAEAAPVAPVA